MQEGVTGSSARRVGEARVRLYDGSGFIVCRVFRALRATHGVRRGIGMAHSRT